MQYFEPMRLAVTVPRKLSSELDMSPFKFWATVKWDLPFRRLCRATASFLFCRPWPSYNINTPSKSPPIKHVQDTKRNNDDIADVNKKPQAATKECDHSIRINIYNGSYGDQSPVESWYSKVVVHNKKVKCNVDNLLNSIVKQSTF